MDHFKVGVLAHRDTKGKFKEFEAGRLHFLGTKEDEKE